ncbi:MAG: adenylate/guanylate cyclase domain-containing protein [Fimbriimonas sp.]
MQENTTDHQSASMTEDGVTQMLLLAERLREANGGTLDEAAISAVAEATGTSTEVVRVAVRLGPANRKRSKLEQIRAEYLALDPFVRSMVFSGVMGAVTALGYALQAKFGDVTYGLFGIVSLGAFALGLFNVAMSKDAKSSSFSGAVLGGLFFVCLALFSLVLRPPLLIYPAILIPCVFGGALVGFLLHGLGSRFRDAVGLKDPAKERQDLLKQLVDLQDKLRSGEQSITFLSVDIVGSTRMKTMADPLSVEFTFTEYHRFVETITQKHGGRVHSTAGDGVTAAFDHPQQAFAAARNIQTGIIELNTYRNKIGQPIVLRCGVHTGKVVTPQAGDITSVNFAHVIDISAHIQKQAPAGGIAVSDASAVHIQGGLQAIGTERIETDDVKGTIWVPRRMAVPKPNLGSSEPATS